MDRTCKKHENIKKIGKKNDEQSQEEKSWNFYDTERKIEKFDIYDMQKARCISDNGCHNREKGCKKPDTPQSCKL